MILTVPAHHDLEIIPRVLALGSEAEVLAPASCRQAIAAIVQQLAERYLEKEAPSIKHLASNKSQTGNQE